MISVLTVTNRPEFADWLAWNVAKQTVAPLEHIIVDGPGTVGAKRNEALRRARGEFVAWFDDDDWQHPERIADSLRELRSAEWTGTSESWWLDLETGAAKYAGRKTGGWPFINGLALRTEFARKLAPFDEVRIRGSANPWIREAATLSPIAYQPCNFLWLCHARNLTRGSGRRFNEAARPSPERTTHLAERFAEHWTGTDTELDKLRVTL